jgi:hypothetical protein
MTANTAAESGGTSGLHGGLPLGEIETGLAKIKSEQGAEVARAALWRVLAGCVGNEVKVQALRRLSLRGGLGITTAREFDAHVDQANRVADRARPADDEDSPRRSGGPTVAARLVALAHERFELGCTVEGRAFVIAREGDRVARWLRGGSPSVMGELITDLHEKTGIISTAKARVDVLDLLCAQAEQTERTDLTRRVAEHGDGLVIDLADGRGRAIVVTRDGWEVADRSPVVFSRSSQVRALPEPQRGGSIEELWSLINVAERSRDLYTALLVSYLWPHIDHPILDLSGEAGTGKSTAARFTTRILDPSVAPLAKMPTHEKDLDVVGSQSYVIAFDNLSRIEDWQSDALCTFVTGAAAVRRSLYTDGDLSILSIRLCMILTSIDYGTPKADLAQRMLPVALAPFRRGDRRDERTLDQRFAEIHPRVLGALLDLAVAALRQLPAVDAGVEAGRIILPRLAGFGRILAALDLADGGDRLARYHETQSDAQAEVASEDEVALAVTTFARRLPGGQPWEGTTTELHKLLTQGDSDNGFRSKFWPATAAAFGRRISLVTAPLREIGVKVEKISNVNGERGKNKRVGYRVTLADGSAAHGGTESDRVDVGAAEVLAVRQAPNVGPCEQCQHPGEWCGRGNPAVADESVPCVACGVPTAVRSACGAARTAHCAGPDHGGEPAPADPEPTPTSSSSRAEARRGGGQRQRSTSTRAAEQREATARAIAGLAEGKAPNLVKDLATTFTPRGKDKAIGRVRELHQLAPLAPITDLVHVMEEGYKWKRPYAGEVSSLDRSGSWVSSAASVKVARGELVHAGKADYVGLPGYYLTTVHPWHEGDALPSPLGDAPVGGQMWVTADVFKLLADLTDAGRWPGADVIDSYVSDEPVRLNQWTDHVNALRAAAITTYGRDSAEYELVKAAYGKAVSMIGGRRNPGQAREFDSQIRRPDITHAIQSHSAVMLWRWADDARLVAPQYAPVGLRGTDELVVPTPAVEILTSAQRPGGRKPMMLDPDGLTLGSFKVKGAEVWT